MIRCGAFSIFFLCNLLFFTTQLGLSAQVNNSDGKIDSLIKVLNNSKKLDTNRVDLLNNLGYLHWIIDPTESINYGSEALEIAKLLPYINGSAYANRVIGVAHWALGNLDLAFKYLIEAEAIYKEVGDSLGIANCQLNLGMAYHDGGNAMMAKKQYQKALDLFQRQEKSSRIATTYTKIADLLISQNEMDEAYQYLTKALEIHRNDNFLYGIAEANSKLGEVFIAKKEFNTAINYLLLAVDASAKRKDNVGLSEQHFLIAQAYFLKENISQSKENLEISKRIAEAYDFKKSKKDIYFLSHQIEKRAGNFKLALEDYNRYVQVKEDLFNEEKFNIINQLNAKKEFENKEQQLKLAQTNLDLMVQEKKTNNAIILSLFLTLITIGALGWALIQRKNKHIFKNEIDLEKEQAKSKSLLHEIELKEQKLIAYALNFVHKNEAIKVLKSELRSLKDTLPPNNSKAIFNIEKKIDAALKVDEEWNDFKKHFDSIHPLLIKNLHINHPDLTASEYRLIALIRLNLTSRDISSILGISPDSVKTARYRLRKKLNLNPETDLLDFLITYDRT